MERCLSLVLDEMGNISLTLEKMNNRELDEYISKNFNSSEEIREKYKGSINAYLEQHQPFITKVEIYNDKKYSGSIVITELQDDLTIKKKKVLYKKDIIIFKEIVKNRKFIEVLENSDYVKYEAAKNKQKRYRRIFSADYGKQIRFYNLDNNKFSNLIDRWKKDIKNWDYYYETIREVLNFYKENYKFINEELESMIRQNNDTIEHHNLLIAKYPKGSYDAHKLDVINKRLIAKNEEYENLKLLSLNRVYNNYLKNKEEEKKRKILEKTVNGDELARLAYEQPISEEYPIRYISGADEEDYPGDLERWESSQVSTAEPEEGRGFGKRKSYNNGHHTLFDN